MAHLPNAFVIPVLTDDNMMNVARLYLEQLEVGTADNKRRARDFVWKALAKIKSQRDFSQEMVTLSDDTVETLLSAVAHVKLHVDADEDGIDEWLKQNTMDAKRVFHYQPIYIFQSFEDSLLFQLRWA